MCQGCSLALVPAPGPVPESQAPTCTESRTLPVVDLIGATVGLLMGITFAAIREPEGKFPTNTDVGVTLGAAGLLGWSSYEGFERTSACREAWRDYFEGQRASDRGSTDHPILVPGGHSRY